jgi:hypothetical protein
MVQKVPRTAPLLAKSLAKLPSTGEVGFEGFIALCLSELTGLDLRLAGSGDQRGSDGRSISSGLSLGFEAKLYTTSLRAQEVSYKTSQLLTQQHPPDFWILCATVPVNSQIREDLSAFETNIGLATLILDWQRDADFPDLAMVCAAARHVCVDFLARHLSSKDSTAVEVELDALRKQDGFGAAVDRLRLRVSPELALMATPKKKNRAHLLDVLSDTVACRNRFGQDVAVLVPDRAVKERGTLSSSLGNIFVSEEPARSFVATGDEGSGKTWSVMAAYADASDPPLTILIPAHQVDLSRVYGDVEATILDRLIALTGDVASKQTERRWQRRFELWQAERSHKCRLIVIVDGLNQRPNLDWRVWLQRLRAFLDKIGGTLVLTCRTQFFQSVIAPALAFDFERIDVPIWSPSERDAVLAGCNLTLDEVPQRVAEALRNPRLLSIALRLMDEGKLQTLQEVSAPRLLFETLRLSSSQDDTAASPEQFFRDLSEHAEDILRRLNRGEMDDGLIFDTRFKAQEERLAVVANSAFFQALKDDPTLYELSSDSLILALAIALRRQLQRAQRNGRDIKHQIDVLLDAVGPLDLTGDIVFEALLLCAQDPEVSRDVTAALFASACGLQNAPEQGDAFILAAVRGATEAALLAVEQGIEDNLDIGWIRAALLELKAEPSVWDRVAPWVQAALRQYSSEPDLGLLPRDKDENDEARSEKIDERRRRLSERRAAMDSKEKDFFSSSLSETRGNPAPRTSLALDLLAGSPLREFAGALVAAAVSSQYNSSYQWPREDFQSLIRFNRVDWTETRAAMLRALDALEPESGSATFLWARCILLDALGGEDEVRARDALMERLNEGRPFRRFFARPTLLDIDPRDPEADAPESLDALDKVIEELNREEIRTSVWVGGADHDWKDHLPAMLRFRPERAQVLLNQIGEHLVARGGNDRRFGYFFLKQNAAALGLQLIERLKARVCSLEYSENEENTLVGHSAASCVLPHLDEDETVEFLMAMPSKAGLWLKAIPALAWISEDVALRLLAEAERDPEKLALFACIIAQRAVRVGDRLQAALWPLATHERSVIRAYTIAALMRADPPCAMDKVHQQAWPTRQDDTFIERWYRSRLLVLAAERGETDLSTLADQLETDAFGLAAKRLGSTQLSPLMERFETALFSVLRQEDLPLSPPTRIHLKGADDHNRFSIDRDEADRTSPESFLFGATKTLEEERNDQKTAWQRFDTHREEMRRRGAELLLEGVKLDFLSSACEADTNRVVAWANALRSAPNKEKPRLKNIALSVASSLPASQGEVSTELFAHFETARPHIRWTLTEAELPFETVALWRAAERAAAPMWKRAILEVENDHALATHALCAQLYGRDEALVAIAKELLSAPEPLAVCRGLTLLGFTSALAEIEEFEAAIDNPGIIGEAAESAKSSHQKDRWARHWYRRAVLATTSLEFWRCSQLFVSCVDPRFVLWQVEPDLVPESGSVAERFLPLLQDDIRNAIRGHRSKREKTLCGLKAPGPLFATYSV